MSTRGRAAVAGAVSALAALAASELAAGALGPVPSLVESVGAVVIDVVPPGLKNWAIDTFGTGDKPALVVGIALTISLIGAWVGVAARRGFRVAVIGFGVLSAVGVAAAIAAGEPVIGAIVGGAIAGAVGLVALNWLFGRLRREEPGSAGEVDGGRRSFLAAVGVVVALAALSTAAGRVIAARAKRLVAGREGVVLPTPVEAIGPPPAAASLAIDELSPLITPNDEFFRIDTALSVPSVDLSTWTLRVSGLVDEPYEIGYDELLAMPMVERYVTLSCVSNTVGGSLVGNAKWLGVPLSAILDRAGVRAGADQLVGRSVDGFTVGFPTGVAFDGRDALVAVGMNDEPLPVDHGFPVRLVVAGLYGYVSATKWLSEIELTTWDAFDAYWVPRGWSKEAPVKTQSRIDTPRHGKRFGAEPRAIAGVAWAPNTGIARVEVQIDEEEWAEAQLAESLSDNSWRQWTMPWTPTPGDHHIRVRATDSSGYTQTGESAPPAPDGATGWHTIRVTVEG